MVSLNEFQQSPVAEAQYAFINKPVAFINRKFTVGVDPTIQGASFSITQMFDPKNEEHAAFLDVLKDLEAQAMVAGKAVKDNEKHIDKKTGKSKLRFISKLEVNEDGLVAVKFATNAATKDGTPKSIPVFDSGSPPKKMVETPRLGSGSKVTVAFTAAQTQFGTDIYLKLYLSGVQVVEMVEHTSSMGFVAQTGGFVGPKKPTPEATSSDSMASQIEAASDNAAY